MHKLKKQDPTISQTFGLEITPSTHWSRGAKPFGLFPSSLSLSLSTPPPFRAKHKRRQYTKFHAKNTRMYSKTGGGWGWKYSQDFMSGTSELWSALAHLLPGLQLKGREATVSFTCGDSSHPTSAIENEKNEWWVFPERERNEERPKTAILLRWQLN